MQIRMDWQAINFDWNRARAFLVTAEEGSLSAAARALGMAQPTLGRQVTALEQELGLALFEREGRGLTLTPAGLELVEHVRHMGEAAARVSLTAFGQSHAIEGTVTITASEVYSTYLLPPVLTELRQSHPGIRIEIVASNAIANLRRREADIAIRNGRPTDPDLIGKQIGKDKAGLYAIPDYLARIGTPISLEALVNADFIGFDQTDTLIDWLKSCGLAVTNKNFPILSQSHIVQWAMVKQGAGIGVMSHRIGDQEPGLTRVLPDIISISYPIWLVAHRDLNTSRRVRLVFDLLTERLGNNPL